MYTDCPGCQRQFHIYAAQIAAANGLVKCGFCGMQFNTLERLRDRPMVRPRTEAPARPRTQSLPEPDFVIPDVDSNQTAGQRPADSGATPGLRETDRVGFAGTIADRESETTEEAADGGDSSGNKPALTAQNNIAVKRLTTAGSAVTSLSGRSSSSSYDFSDAVNDQPLQKSGWLSRLLWVMGILVLMLFASTQLIWFNRDSIMSRYPDTMPWFNRLCSTIDCSAIRHRDLAAIKLLNRDVREHPRYQNALLVNATMSNQSHTLQPYPVVQLNLFDTQGNLIAYRQFQPREYLDETINITRGMTPDSPVHFVLEVLDSAAGAVSFEFEFL